MKAFKTSVLSISVLICFLFVAESSFAQTATKDKKRTTKAGITFLKTKHNFGKVVQGKPVSAYFKFKNSGSETLYITGTRKECGCADIEKPNRGIAPGKEGHIKITFDADKPGEFNQTIDVFSNAGTGTKDKLNFKGVVVQTGAR